MTSLKIILGILAVTTLAGQIQARTFEELRQAEKISLSLTGKPLSENMRSDFLNKKIELSDIADASSKSPDFIEKFAQYWTVVMNIQAPVDYKSLKRKSDGRALVDVPSRISLADLTVPERCSEKTKSQMENWLRDRENATPQLVENLNCDDVPMLAQRTADSDMKKLQEIVNTGKCTDGSPIQSGTADLWAKANDLLKISVPECGKGGQIVKPWWDPNTPSAHSRYRNAEGYRVPDRVIRLCGGNSLPKCDVVHATYIDTFSDRVNKAMTLEPGRIISHVVAEDKAYGDILTSRETILNGPYAYFLEKGVGRELEANFVNGKGFPDRSSTIFTNANPDDTKHYWADRGPNNAGVLTTIAFQLSTNGQRAKANRSLQSFLCTALAVPPEIPIDDTDTNSDLTKRRYCSACHITLEPMASFFNRWPEAGNNNFLYSTDSINDEGSFGGKAGTGAIGLGKIIVEMDQFKSCAVARAFEFVNGRKMTSEESKNQMPGYLKIFGESNNRLRPVINKMVVNGNFLAPGK